MYLPNPSATSRIWHKVHFKEEFEFKISLHVDQLPYQESSLPNYLSITEERIIRFTTFLSVSLLCEMQTA